MRQPNLNYNNFEIRILVKFYCENWNKDFKKK
jgi:hypothetical protein